MGKLKVLSLFSGIGAFEKALSNIGVNYELVNYCEIDKYASKSYSIIHNVSEKLNLGDITKIDIDKLPCVDLITHGSPCQSFSVAGLGKGGDKGSGTRSSLMWNTVEIVSHCKPKYVIWENVKNVLSKKHIHNFEQYLNELEKLGYTNYYKVLNAKDYGVPQNRERIFVISILSDKIQYEFPEPIKLEKAIKDILEENIDDKYYLSEETVKKLVFKKCIESDSNKINQLGMLDIKGNEQIRRVYGDNGLSPTLNTMQGGNRQPKILEVGYIKKSENGTKHQSNTVIDEDDIMSTLTACDYKSPQLITINNKEVGHNTICEQRCDEGLRFFKDDICGTIRTINSGGDKRIIETIPAFRIRKLTPKECWRLMGFEDSDIDKCIAAKISNTQLYKQAGNSIVVNVLEEIFKVLFKDYMA